jgi:hypothetical protein
VFIPFPPDYGVWTVRAERVVKGTPAGKKAGRSPADVELWVTGAVSPLAGPRFIVGTIKKAF